MCMGKGCGKGKKDVKSSSMKGGMKKGTTKMPSMKRGGMESIGTRQR